MIARPSTAGSLGSSVMSLPIQFLSERLNADKEANEEFNLPEFLETLKFETLFQLDDTGLEKHLSVVDALDLFNAVQEVTKELTKAKLENHYMQDFLEKNDPRLLIGLKQRRATATSVGSSWRTSLVRAAVGSGIGSQHHSSRPSIQTTHSVLTLSSRPSIKKTGMEQQLNFRTKTEMAEKTVADVERRIAKMESKAMNKLKTLRVQIEELRYTCAETEETIKNFEMHFLNDQRDVNFLQTASELEIERKLRKFVNNWLKKGRALLGTMRLNIQSLKVNCEKYRSDLVTKAHLGGNLGAIDFEKLMIKRNELLTELDEKTNHLNGLKSIACKVAMVMSEEKKVMEAIKADSKHVANKTAEAMKSITKLQQEIKHIENKNNKDLRNLEYLQELAESYEAPSVSDYIEHKAEISAMQKEEKTLQRKIYILNIKLKNAFARYNRLVNKMNTNES